MRVARKVSETVSDEIRMVEMSTVHFTKWAFLVRKASSFSMFMQFRAFVQSSIFKIEITVHISQNFMIDLSLQSQGFVNLLFFGNRKSNSDRGIASSVTD